MKYIVKAYDPIGSASGMHQAHAYTNANTENEAIRKASPVLYSLVPNLRLISASPVTANQSGRMYSK